MRRRTLRSAGQQHEALKEYLKTIKYSTSFNSPAIADRHGFALSATVNELMKAEIDVFLGQPDQTDNKRNG